MEEKEADLNLLIRQLDRLLDDVKYDIHRSISKLEEIDFALIEEERKEKKYTIIDIDNFKRELKRAGLYSKEFKNFLENYMRFDNK